ncbi:MAG: translation initiation factor IF-3 [Candidatus Fermentibacteraceae bacterium]|nr:translation initiation factor IF-3 [Candidatus Fermentibacteraceae bacterium]
MHAAGIARIRGKYISRKEQNRVNGEIQSPRVRLLDENGDHVGILSIKDALDLAEKAGLDLVEISPGADPPVVSIVDFGKFRYRQKRKERKARKSQNVGGLKEVKFRPNTEEHDYNFKMKHAKEFLESRHKVKATVVFRGRQLAYKEQGYELLDRLAEDLKEYGQTERKPTMEGRQMTMIIAPLKENN